jgi:hypothetical protein
VPYYKCSVKAELFPLLVTAGFSSLLGYWLTQKISDPVSQGYYLKTGDYSTIEGYSSALGIELITQCLVYVTISILVYCLTRLCSNRLIGCVATAMFMTNSQVILVFLSAPFWDFSTAIIPICATIVTALMLHPSTQKHKLTRKTRKIVVELFLLSNALILLLYFRVYNLAEKKTTALYSCIFILTLVLLIFWHKGKVFYKISKQDIGLNIYDRVFFVPFVFTLFLLEPILGRNRSFSTLVLILCLLYFLILEDRIKLIFKIGVVVTYLVLMSERNSSEVLNARGFADFYLFAGWMDSPKLISGLHDYSKSFGVYFSDHSIYQVMKANTVGSLNQLFFNFTLQISTVVEYSKIGFNYVRYGFWNFSEPPIGFEEYKVFSLRSQIISLCYSVVPIFFSASVFFVYRKHLRIAIFLTLLALSLVALISVSRPQMHQWWSLQLFGLCGVVYGLRQILIYVRKVAVVSRIRNSENLNYSRFETCFKLIRGSHGLTLVRFVSVLLLLTLILTQSFNVLGVFSKRFENYQVLKLQELYTEQSWGEISQELSARIRVKPSSNLLKIEVSSECDLSGLRVAIWSSDTSLERDGSTNWREDSKFSVTKTNSQIAFFPVFAQGALSSRISVSYSRQSCNLKIYETKVNDKKLPIIGVLSLDSYERSAIQKQTKVNSDDGNVSLLARSIKFEGYGDSELLQSPENEVTLVDTWSNIGQQTLGLSYEGGGVIDHFVRKFETLEGEKRIRFRGKLERGTLLIGWTQNSTDSRQDGYDTFDFQVFGSIFETSSRAFDVCFEIKDEPSLGNDLNYQFFVSSIFDRNSPRWTNFEITSLFVDNRECEDSNKLTGFMPKF